MTTILIAQFHKGGEWHEVEWPQWWRFFASVRGLVFPACHHPAAKPFRANHCQLESNAITCNWCRRKLGLPMLEKARRKPNAEVTVPSLQFPQEEQMRETIRWAEEQVVASHAKSVTTEPRDPLADIMDRR